MRSTSGSPAPAPTAPPTAPRSRPTPTSGPSSPWSAPASLPTPWRRSAPANLTGTAPSNSEIDLTWSNSTDNLAVEAYRIYRDGELVSSVPSSATSYQDTTVSPSSTYGYRVTAIDGANNESSLSNLATVTSPK